MRKVLRSGLATLALCGLCCSPSPSCEDMYIGGLAEDAGGAGGINVPDGGDTGSCQGTCLPNPDVRLDAKRFVLLGLGPVDQDPPPCPAVTPTDGLIGHTDMGGTAPAVCAPCGCQPPKGSCELPTTLSAYSTPVCPAPMGAPFQSFDVNAPVPWDGQCNKDNPIAGVPNCADPQCIQSLMVAPPVVHLDPPACEPYPPPPPKIETPHWGHSARTCNRAEPPGHCLNGSVELCAPTAPPGFLECELREGADQPCYEPWSDKHVLYTSPTLKDTRGCAACTCGAPVGSKCVTSVSVYTDDCCGCSDLGAPALVTLGVDSTGPACGSVLTGSALGSKKATPPVYHPGQCAPSGPSDHNDPTGEVTGDSSLPDSAYTLCCLTHEVPR